ADQAPADDGLSHGNAEVVREFYTTRQALRGKTFTTQIESLSCRLRHYLARLHRKTLCYSKSKTMLEVSLRLLIHKLNNP
ncbi:MAG: IS1 family transposase, partial [SAR324 cluster bacterium]|nr:IS1 family transposase [SAR324 cluster bacterium]